MLHIDSNNRLSEAALRAAGHWDALHRKNAASPGQPEATGMTVALSRQTGTPGEAIARAVAARLDWPVFDHELLERMADDMHVRVDQLESVDEQHQSWLLESIEALAPNAAISETSYLRHLVETVCTLAAHGQCVIVGRGAAQILPAATTLRVRVVAPPAWRIARIQRERHLGHREAERNVTTQERQRLAFVKDHFQKDPADPSLYDLVLSAQQLSVEECASLIVAAVRLREQRRKETALDARSSA